MSKLKCLLDNSTRKQDKIFKHSINDSGYDDTTQVMIIADAYMD